MPTPDELLPLVTNILDRIEKDRSALEGWRQTEDGQKVIQYVVQIGKYNTNLGEGKDISIGDHLDRALLEEVRDLLRSQLSSQAVETNWQQVSRLLLEQQVQRLTSNPLTHAEGIAYRTDQVYVPLGLVERKRQSRRREDVSPEEGSRLYEETEITRQFEHGEFLEQVLRRGDSPRSGGRSLAIIGEPGAGKTTLLQQMAQWISKTIEDSIVIWISLADLQGEPLENYLLGQWLKAAVQQQGKAEASPQIKDAFVAQFQQERVRLLLDGADEMQVSSGNPLSEIERQVRGGGLLSQARIVLTCRLNLWDSDRHALDTFDTYRTLEFSYPQQVEQFVGQWFGALPEEQEERAERLCAALKTSGKERIRDLAKNPLRLTLLCFNWYLGEGTLPETKAGLYEQFVADFYQWKREQFPTTAEQRRQLNAALGELAREAIDKEETRFRLRHDFVCKFLGEPGEEDSLFQLALQLGWLNQIGVDAENRRKAVYAFFHPTFQEYFAAKSFYDRSDWEGLVQHIFEENWQQIFLLTASLLKQEDNLFQLMKNKIDSLLSKDNKLQEILEWSYQKELSVDVPFKSAAVRAYYLALNKDYQFNPYLMFGSGTSLLYLACSIDTSLFYNLEFDINLHLACTLGNAYALTFGFDHQFSDLLVCHLNEALALIDSYSSGNISGIFDFECSQFLISIRDDCLPSMNRFRGSLQNLKNQIPRHEESSEDFICWCQDYSYIWAEHLRQIMVEYRGIGYDWHLQDIEKGKLEKYQLANKLLVDCLRNDCSISTQEKENIEENLILPISKLER